MIAFIRDENGAVTVDFIVVAAAAVALGLTAATTVSGGVSALWGNTVGGLESVASNLLEDGSFDDMTGLIQTGWGYFASGTYGSWQAMTDVTSFEFVSDGFGGVAAADGEFMLDMGASPGNLSIGQTLALDAGSEHTLALSLADRIGGNGADIYYGGELIGSAQPSGSTMQGFEFTLVGGSGDGSDLLVISGTGPADSIGAYLDAVSVR
jgi:Flp pilus assembly pilin Flp